MSLFGLAVKEDTTGARAGIRLVITGVICTLLRQLGVCSLIYSQFIKIFLGIDYVHANS